MGTACPGPCFWGRQSVTTRGWAGLRGGAIDRAAQGVKRIFLRVTVSLLSSGSGRRQQLPPERLLGAVFVDEEPGAGERLYGR